MPGAQSNRRKISATPALRDRKLFKNSTRQFTRHALTHICSPEKIMSVNPQQN
jgi:hypothetical protein